MPGARRVQLVGLGLAGNRRILYVNWLTVGNLLVAGDAPSGLAEPLTALIVDLIRRQPPTSCQLVTIARPGRLPDAILRLPHQNRAPIDPADVASVAEVFAAARAEIAGRLDNSGRSVVIGETEVVIAIDEWSELPGDLDETIDFVARHGPSVGVRLVAATTSVDDDGIGAWAGLFRTRLVLLVPDAAASIRLVDEARAEDLDRVGEAWPYLDGRILPRVRCFRISLDHLDRLLMEMTDRLRSSTDYHTESASPVGADPQSEVSTNGSRASVDSAGDEEDEADAVARESSRQLPLIRAVLLPERSSSQVQPAAMRAIAALFILRDHVLAPILASACPDVQHPTAGLHAGQVEHHVRGRSQGFEPCSRSPPPLRRCFARSPGASVLYLRAIRSHHPTSSQPWLSW
jgi:hypothetical protein